jgi:hemerythrin-like domain-containing protein
MNEFFQLLRKDHKESKSILGQIVEIKENDPKQREELFQKLKEELVPHMKAEENIFYPPLMAKKETREDVLEGIEEHHVSELVLKELEKMPKDEDQWGAKMSVFKELVEHHIKDEESKIFKSAGMALDQEELQNILTQFQQEKQKIKNKVAKT